MKEIHKALQNGQLILDLKGHSLRTIFHQAMTFLAARDLMAHEPELRDKVEEALLDREAESSTVIGHSVAVPHVYDPIFTEPVLVIIRLARPLNLGAPDGVPTRFFFMLLGPPPSAAAHLDTLAAIARLMSDDEFRYEAGEAKNPRAFLDAFERFRLRSLPKKEHEPHGIMEGLHFTGRFAGGLINDVRRRLPHYVSDFRDGLHPKCLSSVLFLFFAVLAPTVAFGGLLSALTDGQIGAMETLLSTAVGGVLYALFSGQPLTIIASTGPIVVFVGILYSLSSFLGVPFLPFFGWVGLWTAFFTLIIALTDATAVVRFCTRFTDEIFAALIALIYIFESVRKLFQLTAGGHTLNAGYFSLLLGIGTFYIAMSLTQFRRSRYLLPNAREFLADFGPAIAIAAMTLTALMVRDVELATLNVPESFEPTLSNRDWLVDLFAAPHWVWLAAAVPALLGTVLVFMDQNITVRLVNSPDHRLRKGPGFHLDLAVIAILIGLFSFFGLPWLVAATVRSLNHVRSLATVEESVSGGGLRERIIHVQENRVTAMTISVLIGLSLLLLPLLKAIPLAVLFGIFLYMGIVSIKGNQFFERMSLWLMDPSLYPSTHYIRRVPLNTIHKFTLVQFLCLGLLWAVKISPPLIAILFPLFIAILPPVRILAGRLFAHEHLAALDAEEDPEDEETDWAR